MDRRGPAPDMALVDIAHVAAVTLRQREIPRIAGRQIAGPEVPHTGGFMVAVEVARTEIAVIREAEHSGHGGVIAGRIEHPVDHRGGTREGRRRLFPGQKVPEYSAFTNPVGGRLQQRPASRRQRAAIRRVPEPHRAGESGGDIQRIHSRLRPQHQLHRARLKAETARRLLVEFVDPQTGLAAPGFAGEAAAGQYGLTPVPADRDIGGEAASPGQPLHEFGGSGAAFTVQLISRPSRQLQVDGAHQFVKRVLSGEVVFKRAVDLQIGLIPECGQAQLPRQKRVAAQEYGAAFRPVLLKLRQRRGGAMDFAVRRFHREESIAVLQKRGFVRGQRQLQRPGVDPDPALPLLRQRPALRRRDNPPAVTEAERPGVRSLKIHRQRQDAAVARPAGQHGELCRNRLPVPVQQLRFGRVEKLSGRKRHTAPHRHCLRRRRRNLENHLSLPGIRRDAHSRILFKRNRFRNPIVIFRAANRRKRARFREILLQLHRIDPDRFRAGVANFRPVEVEVDCGHLPGQRAVDRSPLPTRSNRHAAAHHRSGCRAVVIHHHILKQQLRFPGAFAAQPRREHRSFAAHIMCEPTEKSARFDPQRPFAVKRIAVVPEAFSGDFRPVIAPQVKIHRRLRSLLETRVRQQVDDLGGPVQPAQRDRPDRQRRIRDHRQPIPARQIVKRSETLQRDHGPTAAGLIGGRHHLHSTVVLAETPKFQPERNRLRSLHFQFRPIRRGTGQQYRLAVGRSQYNPSRRSDRQSRFVQLRPDTRSGAPAPEKRIALQTDQPARPGIPGRLLPGRFQPHLRKQGLRRTAVTVCTVKRSTECGGVRRDVGGHAVRHPLRRAAHRYAPTPVDGPAVARLHIQRQADRVRPRRRQLPDPGGKHHPPAPVRRQFLSRETTVQPVVRLAVGIVLQMQHAIPKLVDRERLTARFPQLRFHRCRNDRNSRQSRTNQRFHHSNPQNSFTPADAAASSATLLFEATCQSRNSTFTEFAWRNAPYSRWLRCLATLGSIRIGVPSSGLPAAVSASTQIREGCAVKLCRLPPISAFSP